MISKSDDKWLCKHKGKEGLIPPSIVANSSPIDNALHESAKRGNTAQLKDLISAGISINQLDEARNTALHWASRFGHLDCLKIILASSPILSQNTIGDSPLHCAAWGAHQDCLDLLLDHIKNRHDAFEIVNWINGSAAKARDVAKSAECGAALQNAEIKFRRRSRVEEFVDVGTAAQQGDSD